MENKSPGCAGGGNGSCSSIISSSTSAPGPGGNNANVNGSGLGNGGSPDSTTQQNKDNSSGNNNTSGNTSSGPEMRGTSSSPSSDPHHHHNSGNCPPNMYSLKWNTQLLSLQRSLANLWDSGIGTDAVLLCQGTPLPVHKIVLTAASPYVASVVQTMAQAAHMMPVIVVDIPAEAGKALLSFLYCGEAHVPVTIIPHLVLGAKFLGISGFGDPGVLESLTNIVPESVVTPDKTPPPSCDSPKPHEPMMSSEPLHIPHLQLPLIVPSVPSHLMSSPVQINSNINTYNSNSNNNSNHSSSNKKSDRIISEHQQLIEQQLIRQQQQYLQQRAKSRSPFASPYSSSSSSAGLNLSSNSNHSNNNSSNTTTTSSNSKSILKTSGGSYSTISASNKNTGSGNNNSSSKSPKTSTNHNNNRIFIGTTSILDNLLKNPRTHLEAAIAAANAEASDNSDMVQYEAEGYLENAPHNLAAQYHLQQLQQQHHQQQHPTYYYSPGTAGIAGHPAFIGSAEDDNNCNMEMTMTEDNTPIPAQLLEPNVEYHIGNEFTDRYGALQNPLADLAKVAAASIQQGNKRKKANNTDIGGNGVEIISSTARHNTFDHIAPPVKIKIKKPPETIICEICGKKFSNAYNLRVHMEGHSGQVFVCSVCSHASRSRDALRKHFAYRHRELWISGMSAFRKNVPGRKLSISKSINNNNTIINNNNNINNNTSLKIEQVDPLETACSSLVDANGNINIRGSDGTLTISEAFPEKPQI